MTRPRHIAIIAQPQSAATDYYRTIVPLQHLAASTGEITTSIHEPGEARWYDMARADVVVLCRPNGDAFLQIMSEVRRMNSEIPADKHVRIWSDFDDDLFNITPANPAYAHFNKEATKKTVKDALLLSDVVTVSTRALEQLYAPLMPTPAVHIIPNAWNHYDRPFLPIKPQHKPIRLFWRGSATHLHDIYTIAGVLNAAIKSSDFDVALLGLDAWMLPWLAQGYKIQPWKTLYSYFDDLPRIAPDWIVVPLENTAFNQAKSNIAWIEATTVGAACLAPAGIHEWVRPGITRYESQDHLFDIMKDIAAGKIRKEPLIEESRQWLDNFLRLEDVNSLRMDVIRQLVQKPVRV